MSEFDYRREASSLALVRRNMQQSPYRKQVCVPEPMQHLCTQHVLVMELLSGQKLLDAMEAKLGDALDDPDRARAFLAARKKEMVTSTDTNARDMLRSAGLWQKFKLFWLWKHCQDRLHLLVDVHGHQIFLDGCFNGDCHPGNALELDDGRLGLIDYGQTRQITDSDRLASARIVVALDHGNQTDIATAMQAAGFKTKAPNDTEILCKYASLFFDDDSESKKLGFATPQLYFASLMSSNPLVDIPGSASKYHHHWLSKSSVLCSLVLVLLTFTLSTVFIARTSFLFRGLNSAMGGGPMRTAHRWERHAKQALLKADS